MILHGIAPCDFRSMVRFYIKTCGFLSKCGFHNKIWFCISDFHYKVWFALQVVCIFGIILNYSVLFFAAQCGLRSNVWVCTKCFLLHFNVHIFYHLVLH